MTSYQIIDADQHIIEPPDLWERWLPARFRAMAPKLVRDEDGGDAWQLGEHVEPLGLVTVMATPPQKLRWTGVRYAELHPGCWEPEGRLQLMDEDGVDAAIIYPPQRTMRYFMSNTDPEFHLAGIRAYNDWVLTSFCGGHGDRLGAIAQMPALGVDSLIAELERTRTLGARGASLSTWPSGGAALSPDDDPFWAAAERLQMPVHLHISLAVAGQKRDRAGVARGGPTQLASLATTLSAMPRLIADTIFHGVCERFPLLRIVGAEAGAGWVPYLLGEMDDRYRRNRFWTGVQLRHLPSEYFHRNWVLGFIRDPYGVQNRHAVGLHNMMWASDFPHHINDWPSSRWLINEMSLGVPEDEKHRLFCGNAAHLYGFV
ncbi:amidohydrolase [bacterium]|nr:amidohydrolase [bacterium]